MHPISAPFVCAVAAWSAAGPGVRVAEGRCGGSQAWVVEVDPSAKARFVAAAPGPSRTTVQFASQTGAIAAVNGGLFDARESPMGPSRGAGKEWPRSRRTASAGVFGAAGARAEIAPDIAPWMSDAVSGWPMLVDGGTPCAGRCGCSRHEGLCTDPAARTAVAIGRGRVWIAVVEQPGIALPVLARWLATLGAERAINLDGGGSTSLVIGGRAVVGGGLQIPTHLGVVGK